MYRKVALIIFYDKEGKILLQNRSGISKHGEKWGYFGGKIEANETAEELLIRFILQERPKKVVTEMEAPLARVFRLRFQKKYGLRLSSIKESDFKKLKPLNNI